jgi:histidinol dehydrogenase
MMDIIPIIDNPGIMDWPELLSRPALEPAHLDQTVRQILADVKKQGDLAVDRYALQFDQTGLKDKQVTLKEIEFSESKLNEQLKTAIQQAKKNIELFHRNQLRGEPAIEISTGIRCWRKSVAIEKVGLYIPGGTAPLFSTLLMLGIPAYIAGCEEIIVCTPPRKDGTIHPAILYVAKLIGIHKIFKVGGVQAIGAMAYGTATIPAVYKIFGPGNQYVTHAKRLIQQEGTAIDMPAGPSELAVFADDNTLPSFVASDLLSQCEHGPDSQVILITCNMSFALDIVSELKVQVENLPRKQIALKALLNSKVFVLADKQLAMKLINLYAPEHLILACEDAKAMAENVRNAGSVFIGNYTPESAGDYASGTNHTLPTNGFARAQGGVGVDSFMKKISFQELTREGLTSIGHTIIAMAEAEGLDAHASAVRVRLQGTS